MSCMLSVQDVFEITYLEQNLGNSYPNQDALKTDLKKLYDYKIFNKKILSLPHDKSSLPSLRCFSNTLTRAIKSIESTPGDEIEKCIMLIEARNYYKHVEELLKTIEQEERGYKAFRDGIREAGIRHYEREKD